jgi:cobalt/nickel transport system ATP-binding protein
MNLGLPMEEVEARVDEALFLVDLQDVRARPSQQLSFGQRKRVALAGALAMKPKVLMMDEPTAGLDSRMVHELLELADELNQKGLTVIMSTHDVETAYEWADEIRVLHKGKLYFSGMPEDFFMDERKVHSLGFVAPTLFELNRRAKDLTGKSLDPYPRTVEEAIHKIVPEARAQTGKVRLVKVVVQPFQHRELPSSQGESPSGVAIGVYGTMARKWAHDNGMKVDYTFNALENCVRETSQGRDFVMLVDDALVHLVQSRLHKLAEDFGLDIPVEVL